MSKTRVAFVVQRYGVDVLGGAEAHARQLAERLAQDLGWDMHVYTTTARDYRTWANELAAGDERLNGVTVHRFDSRGGRSRLFPVYDRLTARLLRVLRRIGPLRWLALAGERLWIVLQGPYAPALVAAVKRDAGQFRKVLFMTYLYYPTLAAAPALGDKALLIPTAHDEPPFYFLTVQRLLRRVGAILPSTPAEARLVAKQLAGVARPVEPAGLGFDEAVFAPARTRPAGRPYILYLGRISAGKGVPQLIAWTAAARRRWPDLTLKLAGRIEGGVRLPTDAGVEHLGFVDDAAKLELLRGATAVANLSPHESLSMIVIEAMAMRLPVIVNRHCEVLRYYSEETATVFAAGDAAEYEAALARVLETDWGARDGAAALDATRQWALGRFSWRRVLEVFRRRVEDA